MKAPTLRSWMLTAATFTPLLGCLSPNDPVPTRWFAPAAPAVAPAVAGSATPMTIARVGAAAHLGTAMVWRHSDVEVALDETNRWVDDPAVLVERALERALFASGRLIEGDRNAARVEAFVDAFEAVLGEQPRVRVRVELLLRRAGSQTLERTTLDAELPLPSTEPDDVARALGAALAEVAADAADWCAERSTPR